VPRGMPLSELEFEVKKAMGLPQTSNIQIFVGKGEPLQTDDDVDKM
jgi:hypothetical protein